MKEKRKKYIIVSIIIVGVLAGGLYYLVSNRWFGNKLERTIAKIHMEAKWMSIFKKGDEEDAPCLHLNKHAHWTTNYDFLSFIYNEKEYYEIDKYVEEEYIECLVEETDVLKELTEEKIHLQIYKIKNISTDVLVAVKAKKEDVAFVYHNKEYDANNLRQYLKDYGIDENSDVESITIQKGVKGKPILIEWNIRYYPDRMIEEKILEEIVLNGEQKRLSDDYVDDLGLTMQILLTDESGASAVELTILDNNTIVAKMFPDYFQWTCFEFENGIDWGAKLLKELSEKQQGVLSEAE